MQPASTSRDSLFLFFLPQIFFGTKTVLANSHYLKRFFFLSSYLPFRTLKSLNLSLNEISALPRSIGNLTDLLHLDLTFNKLSLEGLPEGFFKLDSLQRLYLSDNEIQSLDEKYETKYNIIFKLATNMRISFFCPKICPAFRTADSGPAKQRAVENFPKNRGASVAAGASHSGGWNKNIN